MSDDSASNDLLRVTFSGSRFSIKNPDASDINILDIAHALPFICRYTGQCTRFYSVAEHSIIVAKSVAADGCAADRRMALTALMHDAAEAFMSDVITPIKNMEEMSRYRDLEFQVERAIARRFNLYFPLPDLIRHFDARALVTESMQIINHRDRYEWPDVAALDGVDLSRQPSFDDVRMEFMYMFYTFSRLAAVMFSPDSTELGFAVFAILRVSPDALFVLHLPILDMLFVGRFAYISIYLVGYLAIP